MKNWGCPEGWPLFFRDEGRGAREVKGDAGPRLRGTRDVGRGTVSGSGCAKGDASYETEKREGRCETEVKRDEGRGTGSGYEVRDARSEERKKGECNPNDLWLAKAIKVLMSVIS